MFFNTGDHLKRHDTVQQVVHYDRIGDGVTVKTGSMPLHARGMRGGKFGEKAAPLFEDTLADIGQPLKVRITFGPLCYGGIWLAVRLSHDKESLNGGSNQGRLNCKPATEKIFPAGIPEGVP
jgi:hypothetical protein